MIDFKRFLYEANINQSELAKLLNVSAQAITNVKQGKMQVPEEWYSIIKEKLNLNIVDYFNEDEKNVGSKTNMKYYDKIKEHDFVKEVVSDSGVDNYSKKIPFYDAEVFATISPAMSDVVALKPDTFIHIPMFSQGQLALQVKGHSMKGMINHGDWIVVKRILNKEAIIYGEAYLIVTKDDNLKTVKFIKEHKDKSKVWLVPYNIEQFDEQTILKTDILEMYAVVGLFRSV